MVLIKSIHPKSVYFAFTAHRVTCHSGSPPLPGASNTILLPLCYDCSFQPWFDSWQKDRHFLFFFPPFLQRFLAFSRRSPLAVAIWSHGILADVQTHTSIACPHVCATAVSGNQGWDNRGFFFSFFFLGSLGEAGLILLLPLESQQVAVLINGAWLLSSGKYAHRRERNHTPTATSASHSRAGAAPPPPSQKAGTDKCVNFRSSVCACRRECLHACVCVFAW